MRIVSVLLSLLLCACLVADAQVVLTGRVWMPRSPGSPDMMPFTAVRAFAALPGSDSQALGFRTFETEPVGWVYMPGVAGNYTMAFTGPAHFLRPFVLTNVFMKPGEVLDRSYTPPFDYAVFADGSWDEVPATDYYQTFVARGTSVTHVGFKLATDGVDGEGPGSQTLLLSIVRKGRGKPDTWEQVGPTFPVLNVDCGGPKNYTWAACWNSGDVPTVPGETYAVHLTAETEGGSFQAFWKADDDKTSDCYRLGGGKTGWQGHDLWMTVGSDCNGLVIPYNKRVHKEYVEFAGFGAKWAQTYVAQGRGLASVVLYAATLGTQPDQRRQRLAFRVRKGGPDGPQVGITKIAIGNANYTGDASWGTFGTVYAPGEVPLEPGQTYALEFETIETFDTIGHYVNFKGQENPGVAGFNPYKKAAPDTYEHGTAYQGGTDAVDFDLDLQVIEYEHAAGDWELAVEGEDLLTNGSMDAGSFTADRPEAGEPEGWSRFVVDPRTSFWYLAHDKNPSDRYARVIGGGINNSTVDGGYVQRVGGLSHNETYRLAGKVRCSWIVDDKHQCMVGVDPTGQTDNPQADSIVWTTMPKLHGFFLPYTCEPVRPAQDAVSVWLRAQTSDPEGWPFEADFDAFSLHRVRTSPPDGGQG